jgi:hypothetical protein
MEESSSPISHSLLTNLWFPNSFFGSIEGTHHHVGSQSK